MNKKLVFFCIVVAALFLVLPFGIQKSVTNEESKAKSAWESFKKEYGEDWKLEVNDKTGLPRRLYGYHIDMIPENMMGAQNLNKESVELLVKNFLVQNNGLFKIDTRDLKLTKLDYDKPLYAEHKEGTRYVFYQQYYQDMPVYKSWFGIVTINGKIVLIDSNYYPNINVPTTPKISKEDALEIVKTDLKFNKFLEAESVTLVIFPEEKEHEIKYHLTWMMELPLIEEPLAKWVYFVDVESGDVIHEYDKIRYDNVYGTVTGMIYPEKPSETKVQKNFSNETVSIVTSGNKILYSGQGNSINYHATTNSSIDLTGASAANLTFSTKYRTESGYDYAYVKISTNGSTWSTLASYAGSQTSWTNKTISISSYAGQSVYIRFNYVTDSSISYEGFYADNVSVDTNLGNAFSENFSSAGNWNMSGFSIYTELAYLASNITDKNGFYKIAGLNGNVNVSSTLNGSYVDVVNRDQTDAIHSYNLDAPGTHSWNWNESDASYLDEESNVFYHVNFIHDFFTRGDYFNVSEMNFQMIAYVEYGGTCNAFADNTIIAFYGPGGGCNATSLSSDVIYHEYTHNVHMHVHPLLTPYWGQTGGMMEGWADYFAASINNNSCMSEEIFYGWACLRYMNNTLRYPNDYGDGEPHDTGEIFGAALWDVRVQLGQNLTDDLTIRAMKMQPWSWTDNLNDMLIADDNNGNLADGTPHRREVCTAFWNNHGIYSNYCAAPTVVIQSPTNTSYATSSVWANVTLNKSGSWCGRSLDGASNVTMANLSGNWNSQMTELSQGSHNMRFYCNDTFDNMNGSALNIVYFTTAGDVTPPTITVLSPTNTSYAATSIWANATLNEAGSWCGRSLDSASNVTMANSSGNWNGQMKGLSNGSHNVKFYCNDTVGNMNVSVTEYFTVATSANWTFMVYLDADNNLESAGIDDINEMEVAGSTDNVNIVVQMDRAEGYDTSNDNWKTARRYYITQDSNTATITSTLLENLGEVDMADPNTLSNFTTWAMQSYPAENYILVLWNHGSGWKNIPQLVGSKPWEDKKETMMTTQLEKEIKKPIKGIIIDDSSGNELSLDELKQALNTTKMSNNKTIDIIGSDACLMQMVEVAYHLRNYSYIVVGSEDTEPGDGWDYNATLLALINNPNMNSTTLATQIVNDYYAFYGGETQSAAKQSELTNLVASINNFSLALDNELSYYKNQIGSIRGQSQEYYDDDYIDLYHFAELTRSYISDATIQAIALQVMNNVNTTVFAEAHGSDRPNSHGLTIYFPETQNEFLSSYRTIDFAVDTHWDEFVERYYNTSAYYDVTRTYSNDTNVSIPDNNGWVWSTITVPFDGDETITDVFVYVGIAHTYIGDLYVDLFAPNRTRVRLHSMSGGSTDNIYTWYDNQSATSGSLNSFNSLSYNGTWVLNVSDNAAGDTGNIDIWRLVLFLDLKPTITINSPNNATYSSSSVWFNVSLNENGTWCMQSINGGANVSILNSGDNRTWYNLTTLADGAHNVKFYCSDRSGNVNSSEVRYFTVSTVVPDTTPPIWSNNITTPAQPTTYAPGLQIQFNITCSDDTDLGNAVLEFNGTNYTMAQYGVTFWKNLTGINANASGYHFRQICVDASGNSNGTGIQGYVVNKAYNVLALTTIPSWSVTYPQETTVTCTALNGTPSLYRNDVSLNSSSETNALSVGTYNYTCNITEQTNYLANGTYGILTISKGTPTLSLASSPSWTNAYGTETIVTCSDNAIEVLPTLKRDSVTVGTNGTAYDLSGTDTSDWLAFSDVYALTYDSTRDLVYLGADDGKFGVYNRTSNVTSILSATDTGDWLGTRYVYALTYDSIRDLVYLGATNGKFGVYNRTSNVTSDLSATGTGNWLSSVVYALEYDSTRDLVYLGVVGGRFGVYNRTSNVTSDLSATDSDDWLSSNNINALTYDPSHDLVYLGTDSGKFGVYNRTSNVTSSLSATDTGDWLSTDTVISLIYDSARDLVYLGATSGKFGAYNRTSNTTADLSATDSDDWLSANGVYALIYDSTRDLVYLGASGGKFGVYNRTSNITSSLSTTDLGNWSSSNNIYALTYDSARDLVYLGAEGGKFGIYDRSNITEKITLGAGSYTYNCSNAAIQNYTANFTSNTMTINLARIQLWLNLNGTFGAKTYEYGQRIGQNAQSNTSGVIVTITNDFSGANKTVGSGTTTVNVTNTTVGLSLQTYTVTASAAETANYSEPSNVTYVVTVQDTTAPNITNELEPSDPATYSPTATYTFYAYITDAHSVNTVYFEFNTTNYTSPTNNSGNWSYALPAQPTGTHTWKWYAKDNSSNWQTSTGGTFTIGQASTQAWLNLNGTFGNKVYEKGQTIGQNAQSNISGLTVTIYNDFSGANKSVGSGTSTINITNSSSSLSLGNYAVSANVTGNGNYSSSSLTTYTVTIADTTPPSYSIYVQNNSQPNQGDYVLLYAYWSDNNALSIATLSTNKTGRWVNESSTSLSGTGNWSNFTFDTSDYPNRRIAWKIYANDSSGNENATEYMNFTINDTSVPIISNIVIIPKIIRPNENLTVITSITDDGSGVNYASLIMYNSSNHTVHGPENLTASGNTRLLIFNITNRSAGVYYLNITAADNSGNLENVSIGNVTVNQSSGAINSSTNTSVSTDLNNRTIINATQNTNTTLEITTNESVSNSTVSVSYYNQNPEVSNFGVKALNKYVEIAASQNISNSLSWLLIKVYYSDSDLTSSAQEDYLRIYYYNATNGSWSVYDGSFVGGVNKTENYVWANTTHFSIYGAFEKPNCYDGIQNQGESGVDCGGSCTACPTTTTNGDGGSGGGSFGAAGAAETYSFGINEQPENITTNQSKTTSFEFIFAGSKSKTNKNLSVEFSITGVPSSWYVIEPGKYDSLCPTCNIKVKVTLTPPADAESKSYQIKLKGSCLDPEKNQYVSEKNITIIVYEKIEKVKEEIIKIENETKENVTTACSNNICELGENETTCPSDCNITLPKPPETKPWGGVLVVIVVTAASVIAVLIFYVFRKMGRKTEARSELKELKERLSW